MPHRSGSGEPLSVLYQDDALLVLDKPAGMLSVPGRGADKQDCLSARVQREYPDALVVHRLDMATSGLLLMARGATAQRAISQAFASRTVCKRYIAVVDGWLAQPAQSWGEIDLPIGFDWPNRPRRIIDHRQGKPSVTRWRVLSQHPGGLTTRIELEPVTGRTHQLRLHLLALGHVILGDALYGNRRTQSLSDRLLLHASSLQLPHPVTLQTMRFVSGGNF